MCPTVACSVLSAVLPCVQSLVFPAICSMAGIIAGMFGLGGAVVKTPLMLELGVHPSVSVCGAVPLRGTVWSIHEVRLLQLVALGQRHVGMMSMGLLPPVPHGSLQYQTYGASATWCFVGGVLPIPQSCIDNQI